MKSTFPITLSPAIRTYLLIGLSFLSFAVPFAFSGSQLITGTIVNCFLFLSAFLFPRKYFLPLIVLPSLATITRGIVFGPATPFLFYFLPFIWLANYSLIYVFTKMVKSKITYSHLLLPSLVKWLILFISANIYFKFSLVPRLFLQTMGIYQFITACLGGLAALFIYKKVFRG